MNLLAVLLFCACLLGCIVFDISILYAMAAGVVIFSVYTLLRGYSFKELINMMLTGVKPAKNILLALVLIGMMTALWRGGGTIPTIVTYSASLIRPEIFVLAAFLLNCGVAFLMGTSLGTAATMGVICVTVGKAMGIAPEFIGGAVLSGCYFGDRCSPVSTSALLVCTLTDTKLYENIKRMFKSALVPFIVSCGLFYLIGLKVSQGGTATDTTDLFAGFFRISPIALIPAAIILLLALFRVDVKISISVSIVLAFLSSVFFQHANALEMLKATVFGFKSGNAEIASMTDGGGIVSMMKVIMIIIFAMSFSGIFEGTGLTESFKESAEKLSRKITPHGAVFVVSIITSMIGSNQPIAVVLAHQLCDKTEPDKQKLAIYLEDTAILLVALVPWSTAGGGALAAAGAPTKSIMFACFLYVLPVINVITDIIRDFHAKKRKIPETAAH